MSNNTYHTNDQGVITWVSWNCSMSNEDAVECLESSNHFFKTNTGVPGECECQCTGSPCSSDTKIRNQSSCECECNSAMQDACSSSQVVVDRGDYCECACEPNKKAACVNEIESISEINHQTGVAWSESRCSCMYGNCEDVSPSEIQSCLGNDNKYWDAEDCECKCHSNISCQGNQVVNSSSCECECGSIEQHNCNPGQVVLTQENMWCTCGCAESKITNCNAHVSDDTNFNSSNCECECLPRSCPHNKVLKFVGNGTCECECLSKQELNCEDYEVVLDTDGQCSCGCDTAKVSSCTGSDGKYFDHRNCECIDSTVTTAHISEGEMSASVNDTSIFEGATSATFSPGEGNSETMEFPEPWSESNPQSLIENTESKTLSPGGIGPFTTAFTRSHASGTKVVPGFPQATQTETPCVGAGCDPHISTFFNEKFEM